MLHQEQLRLRRPHRTPVRPRCPSYFASVTYLVNALGSYVLFLEKVVGDGSVLSAEAINISDRSCIVSGCALCRTCCSFGEPWNVLSTDSSYVLDHDLKALKIEYSAGVEGDIKHDERPLEKGVDGVSYDSQYTSRPLVRNIVPPATLCTLC